MFGRKKKQVPDGLFIKCDGCGTLVYRKSVEERLQTCPECNYHFRIGAWARVKMLTDEGSFQEVDADLVTCDPLGFVAVKAYKDQIPQYMERSGLNEAVAERHLRDRGAAGRLRAPWTSPSAAPAWAAWWARRSRARPSWPPRSGCPW